MSSPQHLLLRLTLSCVATVSVMGRSLRELQVPDEMGFMSGLYGYGDMPSAGPYGYGDEALDMVAGMYGDDMVAGFYGAYGQESMDSGQDVNVKSWQTGDEAPETATGTDFVENFSGGYGELEGPESYGGDPTVERTALNRRPDDDAVPDDPQDLPELDQDTSLAVDPGSGGSGDDSDGAGDGDGDGDRTRDARRERDPDSERDRDERRERGPRGPRGDRAPRGERGERDEREADAPRDRDTSRDTREPRDPREDEPRVRAARFVEEDERDVRDVGIRTRDPEDRSRRPRGTGRRDRRGL